MIIRHSIQNNDKYSTALNPLVITCFLSSSIFLFYNLFFSFFTFVMCTRHTTYGIYYNIYLIAILK